MISKSQLSDLNQTNLFIIIDLIVGFHYFTVRKYRAIKHSIWFYIDQMAHKIKILKLVTSKDILNFKSRSSNFNRTITICLIILTCVYVKF